MQSGSDGVLRRMRRRWGSQRFIDRCRLVQERLDQPAITTDIIVGFPGETDAEFAETIDTCPRRRLLEDPHLPVQPAPRHAGGRMPNQVPKHVQQERSRELGDVEAELRTQYYNSLSDDNCASWWNRKRGADGAGATGSARPAATRPLNSRP